MRREFTCIECPVGCPLAVDIESGKVAGVTGNRCPKGRAYAVSEVEAPTRLLTSVVLAEGLEARMVPVRTDKPIPKSRLMEAMKEIKKVRLRGPVEVGQVIIGDLLGLGVDLVSAATLRPRGG